MFVIDAAGTLVYMGAIDDRPTANHASVRGAPNYVREALDAPPPADRLPRRPPAHTVARSNTDACCASSGLKAITYGYWCPYNAATACMPDGCLPY
jgi:hypothetical protein